MELIVLSVLLVVVFVYQLVNTRKAVAQIREIERIFPISLQDYSYDAVCLVSTTAPYASQTLSTIFEALNQYLFKHGAGVADFHLMKDIVDRNVESQEEQAQVMVPVPLYLGLMGTMLGIIVGVLAMVLSGGVQSIASGGHNGFSGINSLLMGVGLAMIASFMGILFTTRLSLRLKAARAQMEQRKHLFLSWLQSELLPQLNNDISSALVRMSENLLEFNSQFTASARSMGGMMTKIEEVAARQVQVFDFIDKQDVTRVSVANLEIYKHLKNATDEVEKFSQFWEGINQVLGRVYELNETLNKNVAAIEAIREIGDYFRQERSNVAKVGEVIQSQAGLFANAVNQSTYEMGSKLASASEEMHLTLVRTLKEMNDFVEYQKHSMHTAIKTQVLDDVGAVRSDVNELTEIIQGIVQRVEELSAGIQAEKRRSLESE